MAEESMQKFFDLMNKDVVKAQDFTRFLKMLIQMLEKRLRADTTEIAQTVEQKFAQLRADFAAEFSASKGDLTSEERKVLDLISERMIEMERYMRLRADSLRDGRTPEMSEIVDAVLAMLPEPKQGSPDTPSDIRNKLESLKGSERLAMSAIDGLKEALSEIKRGKGSAPIFVPASGGGAGKVIKAYDLSSSLNGSTTTFSLPSFYRVISVHLSSSPNILRETTDYTTDGSAMTITFTAQITPATQLASGQTCIIIYAEA